MLLGIKETKKINHIKKDQNPRNLISILLPDIIFIKRIIAENISMISVHIRIENPPIFIFNKVSKDALMKIITNKTSSTRL
jgi:hypothetical protein